MSLRYMYPNAEPLIDYEQVSDERGIRITKWNEAKLGPQPTAQQIADAAAPAAREALTPIIKAEAQARIYKILPAWKQANYTARSVELLEKQVTSSLTQDEQDEVAFFRTQFAAAKAIRTASDQIEAWVAGLSDVAVVDVTEADIKARGEWP